MRSSRPKALHPLCGRVLILHVLDALAELEIHRAVIVVGGDGAELVIKAVHEGLPEAMRVEFVEQRFRRGTADALSVALTAFADDDIDFGGPLDDGSGDMLVLPSDTPLLRSATLAALVRGHRDSGAAATVLTAELMNPSGYGRVERVKEGRIARIVEDHVADQPRGARASEGTRSPAPIAGSTLVEVGTSVYVFRRSVLAPALRRVSPDNSVGEYRLADAVGVLYDAGYPVASVAVEDPMEAAGVNDRAQLAIAEAEMRGRINHRWLRRGVNMVDPQRTYLDATVELATDVTIFPGTLLRGHTTVASGAMIGPDTHLVDCSVEAGATVSNTVARNAEIGSNAVVGPFAFLKPGSKVAPGFVTGPHYAER
jgi:bifunctional UDP-N-acetylglucosamine pyrophosphorylase/glucosamine-1-phosphate N-acetyltransferase